MGLTPQCISYHTVTALHTLRQSCNDSEFKGLFMEVTKDLKNLMQLERLGQIWFSEQEVFSSPQ